MEPHSKLDFGILALNEIKIMQLKITNTGQFSLKYNIDYQSKNDLEDKASVVTEKSKKISQKRTTKRYVYLRKKKNFNF